MATGAPEKSIFRTDQTQETRIENVTLGFAMPSECTKTECRSFNPCSLSVFWST